MVERFSKRENLYRGQRLTLWCALPIGRLSVEVERRVCNERRRNELKKNDLERCVRFAC